MVSRFNHALSQVDRIGAQEDRQLEQSCSMAGCAPTAIKAICACGHVAKRYIEAASTFRSIGRATSVCCGG
jgi:hypothetical protein